MAGSCVLCEDVDRQSTDIVWRVLFMCQLLIDVLVNWRVGAESVGLLSLSLNN